MPLNHVALTVSDRERSASFYGAHFGLTERIFEDGHLLILGAPDGSELALPDAEPVPVGLPRTNHFGFRLADDAAVREAREDFRAAGVTELEWQDDGRFVRVQVADPDGYGVEVTGALDAGARVLRTGCAGSRKRTRGTGLARLDRPWRSGAAAARENDECDDGQCEGRPAVARAVPRPDGLIGPRGRVQLLGGADGEHADQLIVAATRATVRQPSPS